METPKETLERYRKMYKATKSAFVRKLIKMKAEGLKKKCGISLSSPAK